MIRVIETVIQGGAYREYRVLIDNVTVGYFPDKASAVDLADYLRAQYDTYRIGSNVVNL